ncbi:MAG TPA: LamG-like jellyroll fold domain-containing protein [Verrucomicrobiae bacterium]|nr:LamG-like jellyroll fold domain-containing protein [Verrucomicrobiae bacterium]
MKTLLKVMQPSTNGKSARQRFARVALKHLIALTLAFLALPALLSAQTLQHRYSFVSDASDSVGGPTWNGTVVAPNGGSPASINNGLTLPGGGGPGFSGYVSLPAGILNTTTNVTVECWVTQSSQQTWAELWNFNNGTSQYFGFIPYPANNNNNMSLAIRTGNNEVDALSGDQFPNSSEQYVAATFNAATLVGSLYTNGTLIASVTAPNNTYTPGTYNTLNNYLGQDPWPDPQFQGTIYEFRIWNGVVSQRYLSASTVAGPSVLITSLTPTAVSITVGSTVTVSGSEQADVTCQLPQTGTANLEATKDATNWVSSNPSVLTVSSSGVIAGVGPGTATVSAKIAGVTGTSATITVSPMALIHRYSFVSDASDSVGGANGTVVAATTGTNVTINNGLTLPGGGGPGYSGYVTLPGGILTNTTSVTLECWVTQNNGNTWAQIWDFNNSQSQNMGLIPLPGRDSGHLEAGIAPNGGEVDVISSIRFPTNSEQYVSMVFDSSALKSALYDNGALLATQTYPNRTYIPGSIGGATGTTNNVLGQDPYPDPQFQGTIQELRIWNGAVSPVYEAVSAAAGPSVVVTNTTPQSLNILVNTSMIGAATQQATVMGDFLQAAGVDVTGAATNWVSSNPSVLTVNSSGLITAQSGGTATVSATVNGVIVTSATISVANTSPTFTQKPASATAVIGDTVTFSAKALGGGLNYQWSFGASPISGATNNTLTLTNVGLASAGTYNILVSNNLGTTNASAVLTVAQAILEHRYSFVSDASDSVGGPTWNGTLVPPTTGTAATINNGLTLPGGGGGGYSGYLALPSGILTNTSSITVECWVTQNTAQQWATIWDFANDGSHNFEMCPFPQRGINNLDVAITPHGNEIDTITGSLFPSGSEQYVTFTFNAPTLTGNIYVNGALAATQAYPDATYIPGSIGGSSGTSQNWLGNDTYGDAQFQGTVYEFRIWDGAVTPLYQAISAAAGPSVVVTNLTPLSVSITVTNSSMIVGQTQQAAVVGNFQDASGITATSSATNWVSSNPSVLTVNGSGLITAVGSGSATVSATVNGVTGTSASVTVPTSAPVITQQPTASETLLAGATLSASVAVNGNPPFVYRWFFNSGATPISISTNISTLTVPNVQSGNAGNYTCLVSNQYGTAPISSPLSLTVVTPTPYQQSVLQLSPIAYWPLNETSGSTAYDVIGGNNGTYTISSVVGSSYTLAQPGPTNAFFGSPNYSAQFLSAYVDIPVGPFNITNAITAVAWVQLIVSPGFDGLIGHGDASWRMSINPSGQPGANDGGGANDATSPNSINDGNWHMVAYTYTGDTNQANNGSLYVDGVLVARNSVSVTPTGDNLDVWIGGSPDYGTARLLPGAYIADAAVFNQALTAAQVQGLYNGVAVLGPQYITIAHSGSNVVLNWQHGTLLQASSVAGPWTTNSAAVSPYTVPITSGTRFFRLLVSP